jgi:hypothetical protein
MYKSINKIKHIIRIQEKNHIIVSINAEKYQAKFNIPS